MSSNNMTEVLSEYLKIPIISPERKYWMIRTNGGKYYEEFIVGGYVAINYNAINNAVIKTALASGDEKDSFLRKFVEKMYPKEKRPGLVIGYINKFYSSIKKGDIVISPNTDSDKIAFGEIVDDDVYYESEETIKNREKEFIKNGNKNAVCVYQKRRKVKWLTAINKNDLDLKLFKALCSHNTITDISGYDNVVDRCINSVFIKNNMLHYKFKITTFSDISCTTYNNLYSAISDVVNDFNDFTGTKSVSTDNLVIKTQAECPGFIEFISKITGTAAGVVTATTIPTVLVIGVVLTFIFGGKFKIWGISFESNGLPDFLLKITQWIKMLKENGKETESIQKFENAVNALQPESQEKNKSEIKSSQK